MMCDIRDIVINKYDGIEQLIQNGIWRGELYNNHVVTENNRGWLWKTIVLHGDVIDNTLNNGENVDGNFNNILIPVPIVTDQNGNTLIANLKNNNDGRNLNKPNRGIRRLTPMQAEINPLSDNNNEGDTKYENEKRKEASNDDDELITMSLEDTLEIIDLDLSRLLLNPIFQHPTVHSQMRQILFNYIYSIQNNAENINTSVIQVNKNYQQGFHELLGMIYLQLFRYSNSLATSINHEHDNNIILMNDVFQIYKKLMKQMVPTFYTRANLIRWENEKFKPILKLCSKKLYEVLYTKNEELTNLIWLLRWIRLIFLRELPMDYVVVIWDHILTFQYPIDLFMICLIVSLLLNIYEDLITDDDDYDKDDIIEKLLHFEETAGTKLISCIELCKMSGNLCELYMYENYQDMACICDTFVKVRIGEDTFEKLSQLDADKQPMKKQPSIDPNRKRLEDKLKSRVKKLTSTFRK
ncbi:hypothetical protein TPHA_0E02370 [Tetrapisispora phaffii CBS 4417]|uniref:Rab-GAP TBC domain-containing protein n=1 Tax=Tetrapisispora phaffii (strain ATCC 24235 / CBS 4417 / NBRC 1672 / NRRL Y-8282 / UCD 70-5) TaxID=1071381 RepID=G8BTV1_TETPH|nr:hypothetical protein TPHA_0E02370 [Tetrapisispora phaffii CBS 4417]CCE63329.1 hypothetical protein TPHA_0E02370 [Tetrapisispora phaffii CBS 4417]